MTIDQRIERLEHVTAAHIEQAKKDYEENRRSWREMREETAAIWKAMDRRFEESRREADRQMSDMRAEMAERDRITDARFRETGERVDKLVSAIGELCQRLDRKS